MVVSSVGSVAFSAPEGSYFFVMDLNLHNPPEKQSNNPTSSSANTSSALPSATGSLTQSSSNSTSTPLNTNNNNSSTIPSSTPASISQNQSVHIPTVPGIPANADITNNLVAPPLYPCSLSTIIINFPPVPPPNPFPHPGFLTSASKYARSKDSNADPSTDSNPAEQTDSATSSTEDSCPHPNNTSTPTNSAPIPPEKNVSRRPSLSAPRPRGLNLTTTLSSLSSGTRNGGNPPSSHSAGAQPHHPNPISCRPRAAFKGSTSTFIKSSEGLPMSQSLIRSFYSSSSDSSPLLMGREEGEERTFGFYTWNKSVTFVQLSPARPTGETLVRLSFAAFPTYVSINQYTASSTLLDVVIGFSTGDLIYFDPFCGRYTRLNKGGCISSSAVTKVVWLGPTNVRRDGYFVSSHSDGTLIYWDKDREDWQGFSVDPWPKPTPHPFFSSLSTPAPSSTRKKPISPAPDVDSRAHDIIVSGLSHSFPPEKRYRLNPISHWRVSKKAVTDLAFSPDSKLCAVVSEDGCLRIIDTDTASLLDSYYSYFGALLCVCWSSDGRLVFTGGQDDLVTAYSPIEQKVIARCQGHASFVTGLAFDPWFSDDRSCRFASVSEDCKLIFWDLSGASLAKPRTQQINSVNQHGSSRRPSSNSVTSSPIQHFHNTNSSNTNAINTNNNNKNTKHNKGTGTETLDGSLSPSAQTYRHDQDKRCRGVHPAPGRNEVAILQPVMVKEIGMDPLSSISFHRDSVIISSRTGQISMFGRPTPRSITGELKK